MPGQRLAMLQGLDLLHAATTFDQRASLGRDAVLVAFNHPGQLTRD